MTNLFFKFSAKFRLITLLNIPLKILYITDIFFIRFYDIFRVLAIHVYFKKDVFAYLIRETVSIINISL